MHAALSNMCNYLCVCVRSNKMYNIKHIILHDAQKTAAETTRKHQRGMVRFQHTTFSLMW